MSIDIADIEREGRERGREEGREEGKGARGETKQILINLRGQSN